MLDALKDFYQAVSLIDLIFLIITFFSVIKCYNKGFVLSLLSASKWLLAYVVTLILFPKIKPYFKNIIDSEYVLDIALSITIFVLVIFIILIANKAISKTVKFVGLGRLEFFIWVILWIYSKLCNLYFFIFSYRYCV
ncbi:CvpA family protein [Candidatus Pelagibacter sp. Uisw_116]|uniref:CvpA family protein n=1 Tax=Candidatus Pelagibacter sp. Uisw_116 TaxID=3230986 RepID=UPI0039E84F26